MDTHNDGYDLFRRAVEERDEAAWAAIAAQYRYLLVAWAAKCPAAQSAREQCEDLADRALARAWAALTPGRLAAFPNLAALLAYLRVCIVATAIDAARLQATHERVAQSFERITLMSPEPAVLERLDRAELWQLVAGLLKTEAERVAMVERFVLDLPPRTIQMRHPTIFADVSVVYTAIRNVCNRLRRDRNLRRFYDDRRAA